MKIVDVAEFYADQGGGVRTYINQKLQAGHDAGHEIVVVAPGPTDGQESRFGGRVIWVKSPPLPLDPRYYLLWNEKAVHRALTRERPDVVEGSSPWMGGWFTARWPGRAVKSFIFHQDPVAVYPHLMLGGLLGADRVDRLFGWYWALLRYLTGRFGVTVVSGRWLAERLGCLGLRRLEPVPFGIDKAQFSPDRRDPALRKVLLARCGLSEESTLLISVGRHHPEKRLGTLFRALEIVNESRPAGLVVYGDGPLRRWVEWRAGRCETVHLAGLVQDREAFATALASADFLVHGSSCETYGLAVAEAICSGVPVVVPARGGAAELAGPDYAATYPPGDARACAEAVQRMLERPRDSLTRACQQAAAERIDSTGDHFRKLFDLYGRLVAGGPEP